MKKKAPFALFWVMTCALPFLNADGGFTEIDYNSENATPTVATDEAVVLELATSADQEPLLEQDHFQGSHLIAGKGIFPEEPTGSSPGYSPKSELGEDPNVEPGGPNSTDSTVQKPQPSSGTAPSPNGNPANYPYVPQPSTPCTPKNVPSQ